MMGARQALARVRERYPHKEITLRVEYSSYPEGDSTVYCTITVEDVMSTNGFAQNWESALAQIEAIESEPLERLLDEVVGI